MPKASARRYSGKTPAERVDLRRAILLESASQLFGTAGYSATSINQICQGAALSERYFYEAFTNREMCLQMLYDDLSTGMRAATATAVDAAGAELPDRIEAGLAAFIGYLTIDPRRARVVLIEVVGVSAEMEHRRHALGVGGESPAGRLDHERSSRRSRRPRRDVRGDVRCGPDAPRCHHRTRSQRAA